jgi:hypothetical protein
MSRGHSLMNKALIMVMDKGGSMKRLVRNTITFVILSPVIFITYMCGIFIGKERAERLMGPVLRFFTVQVLKVLVPSIKGGDEFHLFTPKMRAKLVLWKPLWDVRVDYEDENTCRLYVSNCPFCEVLKGMRLPLLARSVCEADWVLAKKNAHKWMFERTCQIGTGDTYCDSTYKRK